MGIQECSGGEVMQHLEQRGGGGAPALRGVAARERPQQAQAHCATPPTPDTTLVHDVVCDVVPNSCSELLRDDRKMRD